MHFMAQQNCCLLLNVYNYLYSYSTRELLESLVFLTFVAFIKRLQAFQLNVAQITNYQMIVQYYVTIDPPTYSRSVNAIDMHELNERPSRLTAGA